MGQKGLLTSVIIPTYNRSWGLVNAINSVLSQTYGNFELVIVDDQSDDDTTEVIQRYNDPRIKYFRNETRLGMVGNWGKGLNLARGELFSFLMDDDQLRPDFLSHRVEIMASDPSIVVTFSNYERIDREGNPLGANQKEMEKIVMDSYGLLRAAISRMWFVGASVYRTSLVKNCWDAVKNDDLVLDFSLNIQLSLIKHTKGVYLPDKDFLMMEHPGQNSKAKLGKVLEQTEGVLKRMCLDPNVPYKEKKLMKQELANWRVLWGREMLKHGDKAGAQKKLWKAIQTSPSLIYAWKTLVKSFIS
ncbi:hypothetical protein PAESOLCIP111_01586 [Paenibacillus solanacearum]|uniref:Glycosyltransferase 2-like domain-containing protein n=1 Tax=Paenibacillus solanacearum TaxID=2048548 RepID=A0A916JYW8_9BACL|nr:glycosyltransferase family 2 protein [Paenibacillus solanacearum]CAG7613299.1 hypothetical protein PAESOLCIP111_01586 [Paenibacillus solanacearum]